MAIGRRRGFAALVGATLLIGAGVAGTGLATAEVRGNEVEEQLAAGSRFVCDVSLDVDCAGVPSTPIEDAASLSPTLAPDGWPAGPTSVPATEPPNAGRLPRSTVPEPDEAGTRSGDERLDTGAGDDQPRLPDGFLPERPVPARLAIGDSIMLGAAERLVQAGFVVDAAESRSWQNGVELVRTLRTQNRLPDVLVVHLGANGPIGQRHMDTMMEEVADVPAVVLVTSDVRRDWIAGNTRLIEGAVDRHRNVHLLDWQTRVHECVGRCLAPDRLHLDSAGRDLYTESLATLVDRLEPSGSHLTG